MRNIHNQNAAELAHYNSLLYAGVRYFIGDTEILV